MRDEPNVSIKTQVFRLIKIPEKALVFGNSRKVVMEVEIL